MGARFAAVDIELRNGRRIKLREVQASDAAGFVAAWKKLSEESRYTRFMSPVRDVSERMLDRATHPDPDRELQLVAVAGQDIIGGARFVAGPGSKDCEFAITVVDAWQGQGLARALLEALMRAARERGFEHMEGFILSTNAPMLGLARKLGFQPVPSPDGPAVRLLRRDLRATC